MNTITQSEIELSERLIKACLEKGITEPRYVAQDADGAWYHYHEKPRPMLTLWIPVRASYFLYSERPNPDWRDTLMEWNPNVGVPLADILHYTCDHCGKTLWTLTQ